MGDVTQYDHTHKHGNLNVFQLKTLYDDKDYRKKATEIITDIKNMNTAMSSIKKFFDLMPLGRDHTKKSYLRWYESKFSRPFYECDFQNEIFSKLTRDLHDDFYSKTKNPVNKYIKKLINTE